MKQVGGTKNATCRAVNRKKVIYNSQSSALSKMYSKHTKPRILKSCMTSFLLYGTEMSRITSADIEQLYVFHTANCNVSELWRSGDGDRSVTSWGERKKTSAEMLSPGSPKARGVVANQRLHVCGGELSRLSKKIWVGRTRRKAERKDKKLHVCDNWVTVNFNPIFCRW